MRILAVDDERHALWALEQAITEVAPDAELACFEAAEDALAYARQHRVDVAFLDVAMDGMNGLTLSQKLKEEYAATNIILVTGHLKYKPDAMDVRASGFVLKPIDPEQVAEELANLRHAVQGDAPQEPVKALGPYTFDHVTQRVYYNGQDTLVKPREYHLFCLFANNPGVYFSLEELFEKVWRDEPVGSVNTVYVHISSLRKKLEMDKSSVYTIEQKRGVGYRLRECMK